MTSTDLAFLVADYRVWVVGALLVGAVTALTGLWGIWRAHRVRLADDLAALADATREPHPDPARLAREVAYAREVTG